MLKRMLLIIGAFYIIFYPPVFGMHSLRIMGVVSIMYLFLRTPRLSEFFYVSRIINVYLTWIFVAAWVAIAILFNGSSLGYLSSYVNWLACVIPASLMIGNEIRRDGGDIFSIMDLTLQAGLLQGVCSVLAFFVPNIKNFFLSQMVSAEVLDLSHYGYYVNMRLYGFANGLTYAMPVVQAFLAVAAIYLTINKSLKYLVYVPFLLFSAIVNARTSLVIIGVCVLVLLVQRNAGSFKKMRRIVLLAVAGVVIVFTGISILQIYAPDTYLWILDGAGQIGLFFKGDYERGYFSYLTNSDRWIFPSGLSFVFGRGLRIIGNNSTGVYTDIGYVNDVWLGGIIYTVFIYYLVIKYLKILSKSEPNDVQKSSLMKYLTTSLLFSALLLNLKGYVVNLNCIANYFVTISVFQLFTRPRKQLLN